MNAAEPRREARRAVDDPVALSRAAQLVRVALARAEREVQPANAAANGGTPIEPERREGPARQAKPPSNNTVTVTPCDPDFIRPGSAVGSRTARHVVALADTLAGTDPIVVGVTLVQVAEGRRHDDALTVSILAAAEHSAARWPSLDDDRIGGRFHRNGVLLGYSDLQKHRWPPTGDRDLWVKYGPAGPPAAGAA